MICEKCGKEFFEDYRKDPKSRAAAPKFCSRSCANSRTFSKESNQKKAETLIETLKSKGKKIREKEFCKNCKKPCHGKTGYCANCYRLFTPISEETRAKLRRQGQHSAQIQKEARRSLPEKLFFEKIKKIFEDAEPNKILVDGWDTDVFLPTQKIAIFWNGACHYYPIYGQKSLNRTQNRDKIKKSLFEKNGISVYIIKDVNDVYPKEIVKKVEDRVNLQFEIFLKKYNFKISHFEGEWCSGNMP